MILVLYSCLTIFELVRGIIHAFLYRYGINVISGLATGDDLCDNRLSALMIGYGGANLESFIMHAFVLYTYATSDKSDFKLGLIITSSSASALWAPVTMIASTAGNIDVGDAQVPGKDAMLVRSIVSLIISILACIKLFV